MQALNIGDTIAIREKGGEALGEITIQEVRYGAWCGAFKPNSGYDRVRPLFLEWTEAVSEQSLRFAAVIDEKISQIGISAFRGSERLSVTDFQIFDEGEQIEASFRLRA
jgi:hypothetical protein